mgnify:CR=1 FL=1
MQVSFDKLRSHFFIVNCHKNSNYCYTTNNPQNYRHNFLLAFLLRSQQPVLYRQSLRISDCLGKEYNATVNYISAVADSSGSGLNINALMGSGGATSNTLTAKVEIEKADRSIIIGMDVELSAALETKKDVTLVPVEAIQYDNESGYYVFKYNEDEEIITKTSVLVGLFDGTNYEVIEGLEKGDKIVRAPSMTMKDGQRVVPG